MAQGEQPRLLIASSGTRPLRVVHGASYQAANGPLSLSVEPYRPTWRRCCTASPFCLWGRLPGCSLGRSFACVPWPSLERSRDSCCNLCCNTRRACHGFPRHEAPDFRRTRQTFAPVAAFLLQFLAGPFPATRCLSATERDNPAPSVPGSLAVFFVRGYSVASTERSPQGNAVKGHTTHRLARACLGRRIGTGNSP
jgi:hypothetical protein